MVFSAVLNLKKLKQCQSNHRGCPLKILLVVFMIILSITYVTFHFYRQTENITLASGKIGDKINIPSSLANKKENPKLVNPSCTFFTCFDIYRCGIKGNQLAVYTYPLSRHKSIVSSENNHVTKEFHAILQAISASKYHTSNPEEACIFVPSVDMLQRDGKGHYLAHSLGNSQFSERGKNHLIFNLILDDPDRHDNIIDTSVGQAMIAGMGFTKNHYRRQFDLSLPVFSTLLQNFRRIKKTHSWLLISAQHNVNPDVIKDLLEMKALYSSEFQIFHPCVGPNKTDQSLRCTEHGTVKYPDILQISTFCLMVRGEKLGLSILLEALATKCIPVVIFDSIVMPFNEVLDWSRAVVFIREVDLLFSVNHLKKYSSKRIKELQIQGSWLYKRYFKSIQTITETTLDILADRIFPHSAKNYHYWNEPEHLNIVSPVFIPLTAPKNDGFTAVILTYDRVDTLFLLIEKLSKVPSLSKILVIWNNEYKRPPRLSKWPKIDKHIKVLQTEKNLLSNRFYPFDEIETEAILSIDDDIIMLTEDEIEFAFEVWREFPDRIVGFPSRTHIWDNRTNSWKYESEWMNHISMVLTGAAFYHKYWNYVYTVELPAVVREWVDNHMNCEDIAMNFLVSNVTGKAPIKVTAKKKFRCPECVNTEMLSADLKHMVERTQCINQFREVFGQLSLRSVEFRADPVLFKDDFPDKLKRFNDVGSL
ncbi:hypothetical protein QAD02_005275 [Eretmocerus hayati]|uniref:Uncharacterized protein n=1 Tax=Eretmocerus hayati TaxID=131215 RepID=A0ACC2NT44_9HYME|nr:hypothetical protein QAD02_005275 [Eretmocerus hayati]